MTEDAPLLCEWTGRAFEPRGAHFARAAERFAKGERLAVTAEKGRSAASHNHYFAAIKDGWLNLPESEAFMPYAGNQEALRKHALIATGWHTVVTVEVGSAAGAERVAAHIRACAGDYSVVVVKGTAVMHFTAQSQKKKLMGARDFQKSKDDVLGWIAALLGGDP